MSSNPHIRRYRKVYRSRLRRLLLPFFLVSLVGALMRSLRLATTESPPSSSMVVDQLGSFKSGGQPSKNIVDKPQVLFPGLPDMTRGGMVFFLHVPKTGGSTIRESLLNYTEYYFVPGAGIYNSTKPWISRYLNAHYRGRRRRILFLEIHGRDSPNVLQLEPQLLAWKEQAQRKEIPTFFFSLLREPLSYALSYFNFFHVQRLNPNFQNVPATEANLLWYSLWNPQCQFLSRGEFSLRQAEKVQPTPEDCLRVHDVLLKTMDWIGATETLDSQTLPLLRSLLRRPQLTFAPQLVARQGRNSKSLLALNDLSPIVFQTLQNMSLLDTELYENLQADYDFAKWTNG